VSTPPDPSGPPAIHYHVDPTLPDPLPADPIPLLTDWYEHARRERVQPNPDAVALATADEAGRPSVRIVLCKAIEPDGSFLFYTNYESRKARDLAANPRAAMAFHWDALERQARVEGPVEKTTEAESDAYFATRSWPSRVGAWASRQSRPLDARQTLLQRVFETMREHGLDPARPPPPDAEVHIPRPPNWGGYRLRALAVELWVGGAARVHDRARWSREDAASPAAASGWRAERLEP